MALSYKQKKRWSLVVLLIGLPLYIVVAVTLTDWMRAKFDWFIMPVELLTFIVLGFLWMIPMRKVFLGVGKPDPDAPTDPE